VLRNSAEASRSIRARSTASAPNLPVFQIFDGCHHADSRRKLPNAPPTASPSGRQKLLPNLEPSPNSSNPGQNLTRSIGHAVSQLSQHIDGKLVESL
jgi:hypothetical protein